MLLELRTSHDNPGYDELQVTWILRAAMSWMPEMLRPPCSIMYWATS